MSDPKIARPSWWPSPKKLWLLDLRQEMCTVSLLQAGARTIERYRLPAVVRYSRWQDSFSHWGSEALAWKQRGPAAEVALVFPEGWPSDCGLARSYLRRFHEHFFGRQSACKIYLLLQDKRDWVRRQWLEALEDSHFLLQGELSDWQHDLIVSFYEHPERAMASLVHLELKEEAVRWQILAQGKLLGQGSDPRLSVARVRDRILSYTRRRLLLELGQQAASQLWSGAVVKRIEEPSELTLMVSGRHVHSSLPTRAIFSWSNFLIDNPLLIDSWREIKKEISRQIDSVTAPLPIALARLHLSDWQFIWVEQDHYCAIEGSAGELFKSRL